MIQEFLQLVGIHDQAGSNYLLLTKRKLMRKVMYKVNKKHSHSIIALTLG